MVIRLVLNDLQCKIKVVRKWRDAWWLPPSQLMMHPSFNKNHGGGEGKAMVYLTTVNKRSLSVTARSKLNTKINVKIYSLHTSTEEDIGKAGNTFRIRCDENKGAPQEPSIYRSQFPQS
jgi:isopentenyl diphosphate isomerase/L-lactate dehydrogenase-like FMN-dependent dehydrogenase